MNKFLFIVMIALALGGCKAKKAASDGTELPVGANGGETTEIPVEVPVKPVGGPSASVIPKAVIYKTTKDFFYNVPVMRQRHRTGVVSRPFGYHRCAIAYSPCRRLFARPSRHRCKGGVHVLYL